MGRRSDLGVRLLAVAVAIGVVSLGGLAAAALGQDLPTVPSDPTSAVPDPNATGEQAAGEQDLDTDVTPQAKETELWKQFAGARFPEGGNDDADELVEGSATTFDVDLFDVDFRNVANGFAGGAACLDPPNRSDHESVEDYGRAVQSCERGPVIYRYTAPANQDPTWEPAGVQGSDEPGYIGAIAWYSSTAALAVGGTGTYPRREAELSEAQITACREQAAEVAAAEQTLELTDCEATARAQNDLDSGAGRARAWRFDPARYGDADWHEVDLSEHTDGCAEGPADCMLGMTALDFFPGSGPELGWAGALGQLWRWDGLEQDFVERVDRHSFEGTRDATSTEGGDPPDAEVVDARRFGYRVRDIAFLPHPEPKAFAVTAGCCAADPARNTPATLDWNGERWVVQQPFARGPYESHRPDPAGAADEANSVNQAPELPDSIYSVYVGQTHPGGAWAGSVLLGAGGPERSAEPGPAWGRRCNPDHPRPGPADPLTALANRQLGTARLVSADGDSHTDFRFNDTEDLTRPGSVVTFLEGAPPLGTCVKETGDGWFDWSVGELRSTRRPGLGARALAFTTVRERLQGDTVNDDTDEIAADPLGYEPTTQDKLDAYLKSSYYLLPSYSLNSMDAAGETQSWAVGDRGAILRLGGDAGGTLGSEPEPPSLRPGGGTEVAGSGTAGALSGPAGPPAPVPALASRPAERLAEPELVGAGFPDPTRPTGNSAWPSERVRDVVMSRNGSEGWAIGGEPGTLGVSETLTLHHYDGGRWTRCDAEGQQGLLDPDPACAALAGLRSWRASNNNDLERTRLYAAARVPLERDSDPSNDDEFEVVAVGTVYPDQPGGTPRTAIVRYRDGRWRIEDPGARVAVGALGTVRGIAFTAPGDGWMVAGNSLMKLFHFDGERWIDCKTDSGTTPAPECGDAAGRTRFRRLSRSGLQHNDTVSGLVAAGERAYLYGTRIGADDGAYPMVLWRERGDDVWHGAADGSDGGLDPGFDADRDELPDGDPDQQGRVDSLALAQGPGGELSGWAVGRFGAQAGSNSANSGSGFGRFETTEQRTMLMRLAPGGGWEEFPDAGPVRDYLAPYLYTTTSGGGGAQKQTTEPRLQLTLPPAREGEMGPALIAQRRSGRLFRFDPDRERWELLPDARRPSEPGKGRRSLDGGLSGTVAALAPDGEGGAWVAMGNDSDQINDHYYFYRYTDHPPKPVFTEAPNPFGGGSTRVTSLAGSERGIVWAATDSSTLHRYDRASGWQRVEVPDWDRGRVVTRPSQALAVALAPDGTGIAVGEGGRIAGLGAGSVRLDPASGRSCVKPGTAPPCSTGRDLTAAAVAPDGSALAAGEFRAFLHRPAGGQFTAPTPPPAPTSATITGISMPRPDRAYVATDRGTIHEGRLEGGDWRWSGVPDNTSPDGQLLTDAGRGDGNGHPLSSIAVDASGHGFAVGDRGVILERDGDGDHPWRRLDTPYLDDLTSVTLGAGGGPGALIGGGNGLLLTLAGGEWRIARPADYVGGATTTAMHDLSLCGCEPLVPVVGVALLPGPEAGQAEAWAAVRGAIHSDGANRLLHYASDPDDPLLNPERRSEPLPEVREAGPGALSIAAFGKSECAGPASGLSKRVCLEAQGSTDREEVVARRVVEEIAARAGRPGGPELALLTGDAVDAAGLAGQAALEASGEKRADVRNQGDQEARQGNGPLKLRRWSELYGRRLVEAGVPLYGALGGQDTSEAAYACTDVLATGCTSSKGSTEGTASAGDNLSWRHSFAGMAEPWGSGPAPATDSVVIDPLPDSPGAERAEDVETVEDPSGLGLDTKLRLAGARTHYGADIARPGEEEDPIARLVVLDSSFGSASASDPVQNPREPAGQGQLDWLDRVTCFEGERQGCTRSPGQQAIVLTNAPTYTYGPGALQTDATAAALEQILLENEVSVVISGRLGWNARYWATAPGVHSPEPGAPYTDAPPDPVPGQPDPVPFVIASGAGGKFSPEAERSGDARAAAGFWHGYTVIHLDPSGDYRDLVVEQRPILDWIDLDAPADVVRAGRKLALRGTGREPAGVVRRIGSNADLIARFDEISTPAVTHRYELLQADPDQPWLPKRDAGSADDATEPKGAASERLGESDPCGPYLCLPSNVATIDDQSGQVRAGNGQYPRTYAVAQLSVDDQAATYPLVFEPRASFRSPAPPPPVPVAVPAPPPPPAAAPPTSPTVNLPSAPILPVLTAQALAPPPVPPSPPTFASQAPLDLNLSPAALDVSPPTAVSQPPTPPVNPAPPSGARREARQRQAAAQKSGADSREDGAEIQDAGGDLADRPSSTQGAEMSRHEFRALAHRHQPSAWARDALLGGGLGLAALLLALGVNTARPTPRRREPELPAPAYARSRRRP